MRRTFLTGIIVTVPLIVSLVAVWWIFTAVDAVATPLAARVLGRSVPGLGVLITVATVLAVGVVATNVIGRRLLQRAERWLLLVPVFKTIYAPVRQLVAAFSPDNDAGFKRVVVVEDPRRGIVMGFLTREFTLDRGRGAEALIAVYVPTNHLYLGDVMVYPRESAFYPNLTVEDGIRIFLTGGMALPEQVRGMVDRLPAGTAKADGDGSRA
ncbi:MAG: DUF502 domain-containing protein [Acidobacteria bacterium]|nr:DUF502 domain-containing protein [Acidobacteriota bacterium]